MRNLITYIAILVLIIGCSSEPTKNNTNVVANANIQLSIDGMTCQKSCANGIKDRLSAMEGVASSEVDFDSKIATISYDNTTVTETDFKQMIEKLYNNKYKVSSIIQQNNSDTETKSSDNGSEDLNQVVTSNGFELPNILDFFTNII